MKVCEGMKVCESTFLYTYCQYYVFMIVCEVS